MLNKMVWSLQIRIGGVSTGIKKLRLFFYRLTSLKANLNCKLFVCCNILITKQLFFSPFDL